MKLCKFGCGRKTKSNRTNICGVSDHTYYKYNLTCVQRDQMLLDQDRICPLCLKEDLLFTGNRGEMTGKGAHIDHCHKTGKVRGILCVQCNMLLGKLKDDLNYIERISKWISQETS